MKHRIFKSTTTLPVWFLFALLSACTAYQPSNEIDSGDSATVITSEVKPSEDSPPMPNTEVKKKTPDCTLESNDPLCRPVLVGGEGDPIVIGTSEIRGSFKIEYYADGKVAKLQTFDSAHPERPRWAKTLTYNDEGEIETVTIEEDDNLLDPVFDNVEKTTLIYSEGKLQTESGTKKNPSQPYLPILITQKKYQDMTATVSGSIYTEADLNHIHAQEDTYQGKVGSWNYEMKSRSQWSASVQGLVLKTGETHFQRRDSATNSKLYMYVYCDASIGLNTDCGPQSSTFTKQYTVTTYSQYQGSKLTTAITGIDGDKHDLLNNISDGTNDRNIECSLNYDEDNQWEPYPLPEEVKKLGLSGKEAVKSIECIEGQSKSVFHFHYEPLWKVAVTK